MPVFVQKQVSNMSSQFVMLQPVPLRSLPEGRERLVQDLIAGNPSILGLGRLELQAKEKVQPTGGRIDLVLRDEQDETWYEVEIQLRSTDESHIVRTIEYWDCEKRRHPERDHIAVIVAEEITGRFFNVIELLYRNIPIIAIMMTAVKLGDKFGLLFTKVLRLEPTEVEESTEPEATEGYWKERTTPSLMKAVHELIDYGRSSLDQTLELRFNKNYIGTWIEGRVSNFVTFRPQKRALKVSFHTDQVDPLDKSLSDGGVDWEYKNGRNPCYLVRLHEREIQGNLPLLQSLLAKSYEKCEGEERDVEAVRED
jgi:predicted transport protein